MNDNQFHEICNICNKWYDDKTYDHCLRVTSNLDKDMLFTFLPQEHKNDLRALAMCHDLLEDTNIAHTNDFQLLINLGICIPDLDILTRRSNQSYDEYICKCLNRPNTRIVKCADMCDHLSQNSTLTPRLKNKYDRVAYLFFDNVEKWI